MAKVSGFYEGWLSDAELLGRYTMWRNTDFGSSAPMLKEFRRPEDGNGAVLQIIETNVSYTF
jgi:hypothetical protein